MCVLPFKPDFISGFFLPIFRLQQPETNGPLILIMHLVGKADDARPMLLIYPRLNLINYWMKDIAFEWYFHLIFVNYF